MEVHLVADTNLFFECRELESLPWHELGRDPIIILLTKPVLDEIDGHKRSSGRTRTRAIAIFSRVRKMLASSLQDDVIRESSPKVILRRKANVVANPALKEVLDYSKTDEKLIGITSALNEKASGYDVKLFTDDTGPAATAADLNVPYIMINENWRRPPAESTDQKKIKDLEKDLAIYRAQEPKISIGTCEGANEHSTLTVTRTVAEPLTDEEIEYLVKSLCLTHPLVTDFTPPPTSSTSDRSGEVKIVVYESPEEGLIAAYHDVTYPKWVGECRELLQNFHNGRGEIEPPVVLSWPMSNKGTRPASHVRIEFEATGPVELIRFPFDIHDAEESDASTATDRKDIVAFKRLPSPPTPPPFQKQVTRVPAPITTQPAQNFDLAAFADHALLQNYFGKTADFSKAFALPDLKAFKMPHLMANSAHSEIQRSLANITKSLHLPQHILDSQRRISMLEASAFRRFPDPVIEPPSIPRFELPKPRDPEAFIYDDWPAAQQVKKGTVICELWRHQAEEHTIDFMVAFLSDGEARGTVKCTVHAENLTKPEYARVIVERRVEFINMMSLAEHMIKNCR